MTMDDGAAYTVASGISCHQLVQTMTTDDGAAYTVAPDISCHQELVDNVTIDDCAAYNAVKAPGIRCHQLVDNIAIDDSAAYSAPIHDHHCDLSLQPPVECGLSTSYSAHPVSDTGLAPLHGEDDGEDEDTSYSAHPVSDTGLAHLHGEDDGEDEDTSYHYAHPVSDTGLAVLRGEEASPTTLDPGILDDHGELNHHHDAARNVRIGAFC